MRERFTPVHVQSVQSALFHGRVQKYQEPVESYGQELKRLFQRAYPTMAREESREGKDVLASQFVAGLRPELQGKLSGVEGDFDVLMQKARFEEAKGKELRSDRKQLDQDTGAHTNGHCRTFSGELQRPPLERKAKT